METITAATEGSATAIDAPSALLAGATLVILLLILSVAAAFGLFDDDEGKAASDRRLAELRNLDETDEEVDR